MLPLLLALPNRHVTKATLELLELAGWRWRPLRERQHSFVTEDQMLRVCLVKSHDIPPLVHAGLFDMGFVQASVIQEECVAVAVLLQLPLAIGRMVIGVPENSEIVNLESLRSRHLATRNPRLTQRFLDVHGLACEQLVVSGSPETYATAGICDAALTYWKSGATFEANGLRVLAEVCPSNLQLVAAPNARKPDLIQAMIARLETCLRCLPIPASWRCA